MDAAAVAAHLVEWLRERVEETRTDGFVLGLSGGIDSAVAAALCQRAVPGRVLGLILPCHSDPQDREDALAVARAFGIQVETADLGEVYDLHLAALTRVQASALANRTGVGPGWASGQVADVPLRVDDRRAGLAAANLKPRLRMLTLYFFANSFNRLVVGTGNRSELTVGYFTKHGDSGVDLLPLAGLVKTQVRALAQYLGVPQPVIDKPPSAGLWEGQTDEAEMGVSYDALDRYIVEGVAEGAVREKVDRMSRSSAHKLRLPLRPEIPPDLLR